MTTKDVAYQRLIRQSTITRARICRLLAKAYQRLIRQSTITVEEIENAEKRAYQRLIRQSTITKRAFISRR